MVCKKCGLHNEEGAKFCINCGEKLEFEPTNVESITPVEPINTNVTNGNAKIFSVLSYISILWLIGLLVNPEKNDPKVRFHVGQGIILTIFSVAIEIVIEIVTAVIAAVSTFVLNVSGVVLVTSILTLISTLLSIAASLCVLALIIIGVINAANGEEKPLPVIGQFAFYK